MHILCIIDYSSCKYNYLHAFIAYEEYKDGGGNGAHWEWQQEWILSQELCSPAHLYCF